jgi:hypothetical protein
VVAAVATAAAAVVAMVAVVDAATAVLLTQEAAALAPFADECGYHRRKHAKSP